MPLICAMMVRVVWERQWYAGVGRVRFGRLLAAGGMRKRSSGKDELLRCSARHESQGESCETK